MDPLNKAIQVRVTEESKLRFEKKCKENYLDPSEILRTLIDLWMNNHVKLPKRRAN